MIRSLISEIKEFKKPSILASLFMVFEVMFEISIPFVMASLLDQGVLINIGLACKQDCQLKDPAQGRSSYTNDKL